MTFRKIFKRIKNDIVYIFIRFIIGFFRMLPREAALTFSSLLGRIVPYFAVKEVKLAIKHLTIAFGGEKDEKEIRRLAHETFRHMAMNFVDTVRLKVMSPDEVKKWSVPHNIDRLWEALKKGHGVICLSSHTGCWEFLGVYLAVIGVPVSAIVRKLYDPRLEKMLVESRTGWGINNISRSHDTRDIIHALRKGDMLGILVDQDTKVKGVFVDFFGRPAHTATAPALLSYKYKSPILPIFTYRDSKNYHHACFGEPVTIEPTGDREKDIIEITAKCSKETENFIREHPEQWVWFHRRWKTKPKNDINQVLKRA